MYGETVRNGALFTAGEINAAGGIQDDKGDPKGASLVAQKLAEDKRLFAISGHVNSSCLIQAKQAADLCTSAFSQAGALAGRPAQAAEARMPALPGHSWMAPQGGVLSLIHI